jgi:multisubunit Na+/H+ antiporter MnhB subunit
MTVSGMRGDEVGFLRGFVGGAVGGGGALLLCAIFGLVRKGSSLTFEAFGTVLLGAVGSFCLYLYLTTGATGDSSASDIIQPLKIYTPWQIAFAYVLARVLRPV